MLAKFEVSSFNSYRDMEGVLKFKKYVTVTFPLITPFDLIVHFFVRRLVVNMPAKSEVSSFNSSRDGGSPKTAKVGQVTPLRSPLIWFCIFCVSASHAEYAYQI